VARQHPVGAVHEPGHHIGNRQEADERGQEQQRGKEREREVVGEAGGLIEDLVVPESLVDPGAELARGQSPERPRRRDALAPLRTPWLQQRQLTDHPSRAWPKFVSPLTGYPSRASGGAKTARGVRGTAGPDDLALLA